jgi:hypothetical protein
MSRPTLALLALPAAACALLAGPAVAAAAPTASVLLPCHSNSPLGSGDEPIEVALAGGAPGTPFRLLATLPGGAAGGVGSVTGTYDAAGDATARIARLGGIGTGVTPGRDVLLSVVDTAGTTAVAETTVTNFTVDVAGRPARAGARRVVRVSGTPFAEQRVYAFLVRGASSKVLRRVALGTADACGYLRRSVVVAPRNLAVGRYRVYVNAGPKLQRRDGVYDRFRVR